MKAGLLRNRITIEQPTVSTDAEGNVTESWATYTKLWAQWQPHVLRRSAEYFSAEQWQSERIGQFICRFYSGITPAMRIVWGSRTFDIQTVSVDNEQKQLTILVLERV